MKPLLFLLPVTLFTATALMAQPVMDQVDAPQDGDQLWYMPASHVAITTTGEDVIWDLSSLSTGEEQMLSFLDPAVTGHGAEYPTSNVVLTDGAVQMYLRTDATGIYTVGQYQATSGFQLRIHFSDEELVLPYPCTYNTAFADTSTYSYPFQGDTVHGGGSKAYTVTGFGSLVLPYDTIHNVLMLTGTSSGVESVPGTIYHSVSDMVIFYRPGIPYYVLSASEFSSYVNGELQQTGSSLYYLSQSTFAGLQEHASEAIGVEAWPVPARDLLNVSYGLAGGHKVSIQLYDASGRQVRALQEVTGGSGIQRTVLDVQGLSSGIYLLHVTDDHGQRGTRRVVIE